MAKASAVRAAAWSFEAGINEGTDGSYGLVIRNTLRR
jgi:hypothetical protein